MTVLKHRADKQPVKSGYAKPKKGGDKKASQGTAKLSKGKYVS